MYLQFLFICICIYAYITAAVDQKICKEIEKKKSALLNKAYWKITFAAAESQSFCKYIFLLYLFA